LVIVAVSCLSRWFRTAIAAGALIVLAACASMPWSGARYDVAVEGLDDRSLRRDVLRLSEAWQNRNDATIDTSMLARQFRADAFNMERFLRAQGLSAAEVSVHATTNRRPTLVFTVTRTNRYLVRDVELRFSDPAPEAFTGPTNTLVGQPVNFAAVDAHARQAVRLLRQAGHPEARVRDRTVFIDHARTNADVVIEVDVGEAAVMGKTTITGLKRVKPGFVERRIRWKPGEPYNQQRIDQFARRLTESGLFSFVDISGQPNPDHPDVYDMTVRVQERRRRSISIGLGYQTDTGPETTLAWQHRNLFGRGEQLEFDATYGEDIWNGALILTLPEGAGQNRDLELGVQIANEESDAYDVRFEQIHARIRQRAGRDWFFLYGPSLRRSTVTQLGVDENYLHLSLPVTALLNKRDDKLDPTRGYALTATTEPFVDLDSSDMFVKSLVTPAVYLPLLDRTLSLGLRLTLGSIAGNSINGIPADQRFYAGGGQSIRGYAYQSVGPRKDGQPVGGRSLVESSVELRWRITSHVGLVAFLDGGSAYEPEVSDFSESYQWGAGLGLRIFTGVGPIRLDVGVPVNPREDLDNDFEFYISIGQAF
jgi:translocation and assembly module TamA